MDKNYDHVNFAKNNRVAMDNLLKFVNSKPNTYQFTNEELALRGVNFQYFDTVKKAINSATNFCHNPVFGFLGLIMQPITNLLDTLTKIILFIITFVVFLQASTVNEQADAYLRAKVQSAQIQNSDIKRITDEILLGLQNKGLPVKPDDIQSEKLTQQTDEAKHWLKYKDKNIKQIWQQMGSDPGASTDLRLIYTDVLGKYKNIQHAMLHIPTKAHSYGQAAIGSIGVLIGYIILQLLLRSAIYRTVRNTIIRWRLSTTNIWA